MPNLPPLRRAAPLSYVTGNRDDRSSNSSSSSKVYSTLLQVQNYKKCQGALNEL